ILKRVDDGLAHGHADFVAISLVKAGGLGNAEGYTLCQIHALQNTLQSDYDPPTLSHPASCFTAKKALYE
ncbi:MAG: hypothetical protein ACRD5F_17215, partial [Candidatus Acidiferrales bacterium]